MVRMLRALVDSALRSRGYELKTIDAPPRGEDSFMRMLHARGFAPATVIDVGVWHGTPWLYQFPKAKLVLIEPNPLFEADLESIAQTHGADVYRHAVGAASATLTLRVDDRQPGSASFLAVSPLVEAARREKRSYHELQVEVRTLDETLGDRYQEPFLLKLDIEGYEREALVGAPRTLSRTAVVICEVSVAPRFAGGYSFAELTALLADHNFRLFDILSMATLGSGGPINYIDAAFLRNDLDL
jgi:FkbM family methyltransferase